MNRRSGSWIIRILTAVAIIGSMSAPLTATAAPTSVTGVAPGFAVAAAPVPPPTDDIVIDDTNPFLPTDRDLTDCISAVERPGCGSAARGGWHQELVAIAMIGGLFLIFGRVAWAVWRSQKNATTSESPQP